MDEAEVDDAGRVVSNPAESAPPAPETNTDVPGGALVPPPAPILAFVGVGWEPLAAGKLLQQSGGFAALDARVTGHGVSRAQKQIRPSPDHVAGRGPPMFQSPLSSATFSDQGPATRRFRLYTPIVHKTRLTPSVIPQPQPKERIVDR
jgi:hypothetical protein